jgi:putative hydrolase of HD superfamily
MDVSAASRLLTFLRRAESLKDETRTAWTSTGRPESVAAHTWRLCLWAVVLGDHFEERDETFDAQRLLKLCVVHDLGEALAGDVPAVDQPPEGTSEQERADLQAITAALPEAGRMQIRDLWEEYEAAETPEARVAKALDKLETLLQHVQGDNPPDFDYRFNLSYGTDYTSDVDPLVTELRRILDAETEQRAQKED